MLFQIKSILTNFATLKYGSQILLLKKKKMNSKCIYSNCIYRKVIELKTQLRSIVYCICLRDEL